EHLCAERRRMPIAELAALAGPEHDDAVFTPTGGTRVSTDQLRHLRTTLVSLAKELGYPQDIDDRSRLVLDKPAAATLHATMNLEPCEAAKSGVWDFLGCVLLCDLVRWRFPGDANGSPQERFLAGRRNTFQRLWWRAFILLEEDHEDPYHLLDKLG